MSTGPNGLSVMQPPPDATWNKVGDPLNLYWPRFIKGSGDDKCGLCPICAEPPERGGDGEQKWFKVSDPPPPSSRPLPATPDPYRPLPAQEQQLRLPHELCSRSLERDRYVLRAHDEIAGITDGTPGSAGKPISPPVKTRVIELPQSPKDQRSEMVEGLCHKVCGPVAFGVEKTVVC